MTQAVEVPHPAILPGLKQRWARLITHGSEADPLFCPQSGGTMKVIAVIEPACGPFRSGADKRSTVIRKILDHLGLPTAAPHVRAPPDPPDALAAHQPRKWSYEPLFDD